MGNRHLSRSIVLQSLFEWDFNAYEDEAIGRILDKNVEEFAPGMGDFSFTKELAQNILSKRADIDAIIQKAAPEWPIDKISIIDRNVLRIGLYELLFAPRGEVPAKVAINEAIELGKTFGGENSGKFVNGVLGAVYKEIGEPGKEEVTVPKVRTKEKIDKSTLPVVRMIGAVVYAKEGKNIYVALVHDIFGRWTLSKGRLTEEEGDTEGVVRKVQEEIGLGVVPTIPLGSNEYVANDPEQGKILKKVNYYLAEGEYQDLVLGESGGLDDAKWFKLPEIVDLNMYDDILPIVTKGVQVLLEGGAEPEMEE
jgi:N utilization substance protein B